MSSETISEMLYIKDKNLKYIMDQYHVGVNSYWIEIGKFEGESGKLTCKRLNRKNGKIGIYKHV